MHFASDNWAGAHPSVAASVLADNGGYRASYGNADQDRALDALFSTIFETDVQVFLVATGTAANALCLSAMAKPGAIMMAHTEAHVRVDECGAPLFFSQGMQIEPVAGAQGKIALDALQLTCETVRGGGLNAGRIGGLSLTQATESGTVYSLDELRQRAALMADMGLHTHMDGARFANALVALDCSPADMTWRSGIDVLSFGGTKNGCWCAEAVVVFNQDLAGDMAYLRKRSGHLVSKMRFMTSQFEAYLDDGLWLKLAAHANSQAQKLRTIVKNSNRCALAWDGSINEVFVLADITEVEKWRAAGLVFSDWQPPAAERHLVQESQKIIRLVTCFATSDDEITCFAQLLI